MRSKILQDFYKKLAQYNYMLPSENLGQLIIDFYFLESLRKTDLSPKRQDIELQSFYETTLNQVTFAIRDYLIEGFQSLLPYLSGKMLKEANLVLLNLEQSQDLTNTIYWVDRGIQFEHNASMRSDHSPLEDFDAIITQKESEDYDMDSSINITWAIDIKYNIRSIQDYLEYVSSSLLPFAYKVIYNLTGKTQEMLENI